MEVIILDEGGRKVKRQEIFNYFQSHKNMEERRAFIENAYTETFVEVLTDGVRIGYHKEKDGLLMWEGSFLTRTAESVFSWGVITEMTENLIERGEYKIKLGLQNAPIMAEQLSLFDLENPTPMDGEESARTELFPIQEIPQAVIDQTLYTAGNEFGSASRIAAFYMREHPEEETIAFLKREFGTENGRGIEYDGRKYAVWFIEDGIHLACGTSVRDGYNRTTVTWGRAAKRILELLEAGTYLSAGELAEAQNRALSDMAESLILTARDLSQEGREMGLFAKTLAVYDEYKVFPDCSKALAEKAQEEPFLQKLAQEYDDFRKVYKEKSEIMRCRMTPYSKHRIESVLGGVKYHKRSFEAQPDFLRQCKMFITQDEIDHYFLSGPLDSRLAVYSHFCRSNTKQEHQDYIKSSFGEYSGGSRDGYSYTKTRKGLEYERAYGRKKYDTVHLGISDVVKRYERLIAQKRFPGEDAIARIPDYELHQLARTIYFGYSGVPFDMPHPYPPGSDYYKAVPTIQEQLSDPARVRDMLDTLTAALDGVEEDNRYRSSMEYAKKQLLAYMEGSYTLFNGRHPGIRLNNEVPAQVVSEPEPERIISEEPVAEYHTDEEHIAITQAQNGKFFNQYGYDEETGQAASTAGGFDTLDEAESALHAHRPTAEKIPEQEQAEPVPPPSLAPPLPKKKERLDATSPLFERGSNYRITDDTLGAGTPSERYANNIAAIKTLKQLDDPDHARPATEQEQEILARYVGWGGLADCFDPHNSRYAELKSLLSDAEYAVARESTLTAFYTPPTVIRAMYQAISQMGFTQGNILEPACGTGNFLGLVPDSMAESKLYGVELDDISGRIARHLYQRHSISVRGYEKMDFPDNFFDVAVGNVPFGQFKVADRRYNRLNLPIHEYFIAKTLDKVRPGGVIAFVTSSFIMDKCTSNTRKYIAQRAELLGAIRLPNTTFKAAAGTEVTSDILFLQKRDRMVDIEPEWVHLATDDNGIQMNSYFIDHPDMILGEMKMVSGPFGPEPTCAPYADQDLEALLSNAIQNIHGEIGAFQREDDLEEEDLSIPADPTVRNFSYTLVDGKIYYRENSRMNPAEVSKTTESRIKGMIELRDCVRTLLEYQTEDLPEKEIKEQQAKLNALYDRYTRDYGLINSRGNSMAFDQDSSYFLLCSLEVLDEDGKLKRKADLFTKRTIRSHKPAERVDTAVEALALSIGEKARVDMEYMSQLTGKDEDTLFAELTGVVFLNPNYTEGINEKYLPADEYLSGNVRQKLAAATKIAAEDPRFQINADALAKVQPVDLTASEISVRLGATWLNPEYIRQFVFETLGTPRSAQWKIKVHYSQSTGEWRIEGKSQDRGNVKANSTYGTKRINAYEIIESSLNLKDVRIFDYMYDDRGNRTAVLNKKETAIAQSKQEQLKDAFSEWIWKDPNRRETICKAYNILFNSNRPREYDGSHITFNGMTPEITLRRHQVNAIAHILYGGNTLLAHVVGAGKSATRS